MSDVGDDAQAVEDLLRGVALRQLRSPAPPARLAAHGVCGGCGDPIEQERLTANPAAHRCLQCQEACERRQRLFRKCA